MRRALAVLALLTVTGGCATQQSSARIAGEAITPSSQRIYLVGEQAYEAGHYDEAVALWRHALLQLPQTQSADQVRHKLILRIAHGQLMAHHHGGGQAHLENAQAMLARYLAKHDELFGDNEAAQTERGQVYEILYEVESRLGPDPEVAGAVEPDIAEQEAIAKARSEEPVDTHAGEDLDDSFKRVVHVGPDGPDVNDPATRELLASDFVDAEAGLVLTAPGVAMIHGPRPLLRASALPVLATPDGSRTQRRAARRSGWDLLRSARPELKRCYESAFSRDPEKIVNTIVEAKVHPDGRVSHARIVEGGLVDGLGDVCLIETVEATRIAARGSDETVRVRLPLRFFYQDAVYMIEGNGAQFSVPIQATSGQKPDTDTAPRRPGKQINQFDRAAEP